MWVLPSEISDALAAPDTAGKELLTKVKVGKALKELGYRDHPEFCHAKQEKTDTGHAFTARFYDWGEVHDKLVPKLLEMWPTLKLKANGDTKLIDFPSHIVYRDGEIDEERRKKSAADTREWSPYQKAIFAEMRNDGHVVVMARAGSGKTTTLVEALSYLPPSDDILLTAFNKSIQMEMEERAPNYVDVRTLHSIGFGLIRRNLGLSGNDVLDNKKVPNLASKVLKSGGYEELLKAQHAENLKKMAAMPWAQKRSKPDEEGAFWDVRRRVYKLVGLMKNTLTTDDEGIAKLYDDYDIGDSKSMSLIIQAAKETMELNNHATDFIDFDDMIWFPYYFGFTKMKKYDTVLVDEAQDLNAAQIWLIKKLCRPGGRIITVGDDRQAIYGFRGADRHAIDRIIDGLNAKTLPLSISYRCPVKVVYLAKQVVEDIEPAPNAAEGTVARVDYASVISSARPGDFILSRTNAPLMGACLELLRRGVPATVAGKDIGTALQQLVKKSKTGAINELNVWLSLWLKEEKEKSKGRERYYQLQCDKAAALRILMDDCRSIGDIVMKLDRMFSDDTPTSQVVCSTVHKAKGLERPRVWMLDSTFYLQHEGIDKTEEANIWYVAVTRSQSELYLCDTPVKQILSGEWRLL